MSRTARGSGSPPLRRVVVTAGPTHEAIDPVRYLVNTSSGRMGFEIARAAARRGDRVRLVAGPVHLGTPPGVERVDVVSARDMLQATREAFADADALFMAAAVADYRPRRRRRGKWRKEDEDPGGVVLELTRNPDVLATLARRKGPRLVVGFALETSGGLARARAKRERKHADYIVWNDASALGAERSTVTVLGPGDFRLTLEDRTKREIATRLVRLATPPRD